MSLFAHLNRSLMCCRYVAHVATIFHAFFYSFTHSVMKSFPLGVVAGLGTAAVAIPLFVGAASSDAVIGTDRMMPSLTQEHVQSMVQRDQAVLTNIDAAIAVQKDAIRARMSALTSAAAMTDDTQRQQAVKAAHDAYHTTIQDALAANPDLEAALHLGGFGGKHGGRHGPGHLAAKLNLTQAELKAKLDAGEAIEDIAKQQGVDLPARPAFRGFFGDPQVQSSSTQSGTASAQ
jgi:hypothetical protein